MDGFYSHANSIVTTVPTPEVPTTNSSNMRSGMENPENTENSSPYRSTEWATQKYILSHPSTGDFLTHCPWNSLMEGMSAGLPLIALLMQPDKGLNARLIVNEMKVGVEVARHNNSEANV